MKLYPNQKMPVLEDDGFVLWESSAILYYLASQKPGSGLWPANPQRQSEVLRWLSSKQNPSEERSEQWQLT